MSQKNEVRNRLAGIRDLTREIESLVGRTETSHDDADGCLDDLEEARDLLYSVESRLRVVVIRGIVGALRDQNLSRA